LQQKKGSLIRKYTTTVNSTQMMQRNFYVTHASHDFAHHRCSAQSTMIKVLSFHFVLTLHLNPYWIGRVPILKTKKVNLYETLNLR